MTAPEYIAAPDTLLGLLQRGRGEGYRRILAIPKPEAHALLIQCISHDPRLDSQLESREEYYASIAIEIELPLEPVAESLRQNDDPSQNACTPRLIVSLLTELAKRGYRNADEILCDYIRWGQLWDWPVDELLSLPEDGLSRRIAIAIEERFPTEKALDEAVDEPTESFVHLARFSSRIEASLAKVLAETTMNTPPELASLSAQELLDMADDKNFWNHGHALAKIVEPTDIDLLVSRVSIERAFVTHVALAGLTKIAPASLFKWLTEVWLTIPGKDTQAPEQIRSRGILRRGVSRAILAFPAEDTLPLARDCITHKDPRKRELAEDLLQKHATAEDLPCLRKLLLPMLTDEDAEWSCFLIKAFNNFPNVGIVQELLDIFHHFHFSMGRCYAVEAIQITSPDFFAKTLAIECLWDCEERNRQLGARFAPLASSETVLRIRQLAEDPFESEQVRHEAKARIEDMA